jgi:hypothetical protein
MRKGFYGQLSGLAVRLTVTLIVCSFTLNRTIPEALAQPSGPPPAGQVWVETPGRWVLVPAPPSDGPYIWAEGGWVPDPTPPPVGKEWVPAHWGPGGWVRGHWEAVVAPGPGTEWVVGHWERGHWMPGHWMGGPRGRVWVPGHRGPRGAWIPGHWR